MKSQVPDSYFSTRFSHDAGRQGVWREIVRFVSRDFAGRASILELGPGYCDFINQANVRKKYAIDLSDEALQHAAHDVDFHVGDCADLSFLAAESIETTFASNLLEHLERPRLEETLREVRRVLKPGGRLLLIQPNFRLCYANYFDDYTHVTVFSDISLTDFLRAHGFSIVRCIPGLLPFSMKSRLPKWPVLVRAFLHAPFRPGAKQMYVVAEKPL